MNFGLFALVHRYQRGRNEELRMERAERLRQQRIRDIEYYNSKCLPHLRLPL